MTTHRYEKNRNWESTGLRQEHVLEWDPIPMEEQLGTQTITIEEYYEHQRRTL